MDEKIGSVTINRREQPDPVPEHDPWAGVGRPKEDGMAQQKPEIKMEALKTFLANDGRRLTAEAEYSLYSEREAVEHVAKGLGKRLSPEATSESEGENTPAPAEESWKLQLSPEDYLERFPQGPNAEQARAEITRRKSAGGEKTETKSKSEA